MNHNCKADLITIGQWLESNVFFQSFEKFTSNEKYEEIGDKFVRYVKKIEEGRIFYPKEALLEYEVHAIMKHLVTFRLTPHAIAFSFAKMNMEWQGLSYSQNRIPDEYKSKTVLYLSDRALCKFYLSTKPSDRVAFAINDYFETFPDERVMIMLDGLESLEKGEGKALLENALRVMERVPVLLQAGFLHYGDYECEENMDRVNALVRFYESLGFENINDIVGNCEESVIMLANRDTMKEESIELE